MSPVEGGTDFGADQQFLLEIMEINERLDETQSKEEADNIGVSIKGNSPHVLHNLPICNMDMFKRTVLIYLYEYINSLLFT